MRFKSDKSYAQLLESLDTSLLELLNHRLEGCAPWSTLIKHPKYDGLTKQLLADPKSDPFYPHVIEQQRSMTRAIKYLQHSHAAPVADQNKSRNNRPR